MSCYLQPVSCTVALTDNMTISLYRGKKAKKTMDLRYRKRSLSLAIRKHLVVTVIIVVVIAALLAVVAVD